MSITLDAVLFNCQPGVAGITALNLRRNASTILPLPEWQAGATPGGVHSPVAYATSGTWGLPILIQARFRPPRPGVRAVEVRAIPDSPARSRWAEVDRWLPTTGTPPSLDPRVRALRALVTANDHVLGEAQPRWITFPTGGETGFETFRLVNHRLWSAGVGIHTITWRWQYREATSLAWTDFAVSRHRVYLILEVPKLPWLQTPFSVANTQLPWTDVLDHACHWAQGARRRKDALRLITESVFRLGPKVVSYGCPIFALTQYSLIYFDCTAFLDRLAGGYGNGPYVNCSDCATIVSSFANILGCDLWQSRIGPAIGTFFNTNPIRVIGYPDFSLPCGIATGFQFHEVAWGRECGFDDPIWDACVLVSASFNPSLPPYLPLLPADLPFAGTFGYDYRGRLAAPDSLLNCVPQPLTRQRRMLI